MGNLARWIDADSLHEREVDQDPAVADGLSPDAVTAPANRAEQVPAAGELDRSDHVGGSGTPHNQGGTLVDHRVEDAAYGVVVAVARGNHVPPQARHEFLKGAPRNAERVA